MRCIQCKELCNYTINDFCINCYLRTNCKNDPLINEYIKQGHSINCAIKMTWGDGKCDCYIEKQKDMYERFLR